MRRRLAAAEVIGRLPTIGFGTVPLGNLYSEVSDAQAADALSVAWDAGVRWFDTAPVYGMGLAERRLGRAMREWPREEYVLSSKVGRVLRRGIPLDPALAPGGRPFYVTDGTENPVFDFSAAGVDRSLEQSFERLGTDHLDMVFVHDPDDHLDQAVEETIPHLVELRREGVVGAIGVGMTSSAPCAQLVERAPLDVVMIAGRYTLLDHGAAAELLPLCSRRGVGVVVGGVFNSGILAGGANTFDYVQAPASVMERAEALKELCDAFAVPLPALAIAFSLRHPAVRSAVLGMRSPAEVLANAGYARTPIPEELWQTLDAAWPLSSMTGVHDDH